MNKLFTKVAALTLGVAMAAGVGVSLGSAKVGEAKADDTTYSKITSLSDLTSGSKYLIVYETGNVAFDGSLGTFDAVGNSKSVAISDGSITTSEACYFTFVGSSSDGYSIQGSSGKYINQNTDANGLATSATAVAQTVSFDANGNVEIVGPGGAHLRYNTASNQTRFRYYKSSTYTAQQAIQLYKSSGDTPTPVNTFTVTGNVEHGSVSPSSVNEGATLTATITPDSGYVVPESVTVTMGGQAAAGATYSNGVVTLSNVTGAVVISGSCPEKQAPQHVDLPDGDYTATFPYANPFPTEIDVLDSQSAKVAQLTSSISAVNKYEDGFSEYVLSAGATIEIDNLTNGKISKVDIHIYQYTNFDVFVDDASSATYTGPGTNAGNDAHIEVITNACNKVKIVGNGGDNGSRTFKVFDVKVYITVTSEPVPVTGVELSAEEATIAVGATYNLTAAVSPLGADNPAVTWLSSAPEIASVANNGVVTGVAKGDAVITVTTVDGGFTDTFTAHVVEVNYGSESNPLTVEQARAVLDISGAATSLQKLWVVGEVYSSSYNSSYQDYTVWLKSSDGSVNEYFEIYSGSIAKAITEDDTQANALAGVTVLCNGYGKIHNGSIYELFKVNNEKPTIAEYSETPVKTLVSIAVTHQPTKTVYEIGDQLSTEGLVVTATYSDESTATIESGLAFSGFDSSSAGQKTVTVTYEGKSATFNVTVNAPAPVLTGIEVTVPPTKLSYAVGEELDTTGLVVTATYSVGDPQVVSQGLTFTGYNKDQVGQQTVVVHYEDQTAEFTVTVSEPVLVGIEVTQLPTKVEYGYGEEFDPSGIEVTASYSIGEPKVVTEGLEYSGFDSEEVGPQTITVSYQGETAEFEVSVVVKDWLPEQKEAFVEYVGKELPFLGEAFVYSLEYDGDEGYFGAYAEGSYVNAIKSACSSWDYYYYDEAQEAHYITDPNGDGRAVLCFYEYNGYTVIQYWAEVVDHVLVADGDFNYYVGDSLDVSSLVVYVVDKTETKGSPVPASQCSFSVTNFTEEGLVDIEIKYAYYYGTFQVLVSPVVATSLSLDVSSAIKTFKVGDEFDPTGVVSTLHFNNGSTQDVSDQVEFSGFDSSSVGEKTITVTYGDFEAEYVVNVVPAYDADSFGEEFLARISTICNGYDGRTNNKDALRTVWKTMEQKYLLSLSDAEKLRVINAKADENGSNLEKAMAFYDYACKKYRLDKFIENRVINAQVLEPETTNNNIPVIIAVVSAIAGITLIGVIITYRRRRSLYIK